MKLLSRCPVAVSKQGLAPSHAGYPGFTKYIALYQCGKRLSRDVIYGSNADDFTLGAAMIRLAMAMLALTTLVVGCSTPIRSQSNAYAYLGRVVDTGEDMVVEPRSREVNARENTIAAGERAAGPNNRALASTMYDLLPQTKTARYHRYVVALEEGEQVSLRSHLTGLNKSDCVRVWILGPGTSPVYLYAPDQAEIEKAEGCK